MAEWAKVKFFWETMLGSTGSTLTASSTDGVSDYNVTYIYNMLETNRWKAATATGPHYITCDGGAGSSKNADYLAISGHNLNKVGASVTLQFSTDNFNLDVNNAFLAEAVPSDKVYLKEFIAPGLKRYWRLKITGTTAPPEAALCIWGEKTELDYMTGSFDPDGEDISANINVSYSGYVTGIHQQYSERRLMINFQDGDPALYQKVKSWWEGSGLKNFFVGWETANRPDEVYLMRPGTSFVNTFTYGGAYRNITIKLSGRKE